MKTLLKNLCFAQAIISIFFINIPLKSQINTSLPVGTTNGQGIVIPSGAFTYEVPLFTPEGTGGLAQQISLIYNNQSGDGVMGLGWSITGLSSIYRTPKTVYHDGITDGVKFVNSDALSIDGSRLVCISGTHGMSGSKYRTENESFVDITQNGNGTNSSFLVKTKEGYELHFGISNNSRLKGINTTAISSWMLEKIVDLRGNQILFFYNNEPGEATLNRIEYSGNIIRFTYNNRPDPGNFYIGGFRFNQTRRISTIKMESDGSTIREYSFSYETGSPTLLSTITEYGSDGQSINPLVFSWGTTAPLIEEHSVTNLVPSGKAAQFYYGDFNGNGRMDIVVAIRPDSIPLNWERWDLFLANSNGTSFTKRSGGTLGSWFKGFYVADVNNDGKMDLLLRRRITNQWCCQTCEGGTPPDSSQNLDTSDEETIWVNDSTIQINSGQCCFMWCSYETENFLYYTFNGTTLARGGEQYDLVLSSSIPDDVIMHAGLDFNGDGRTDYLVLDKDNNMVLTRIGGSVSKINLPNFNTPDNVEFLDFNGDGRTDIMVIKDNNTRIFTFNPATFQWDILYNAGFPTKGHRVFLGDFNGDGKTDILTWISNNWYLSFSTGSAYTLPHIENLPFHKAYPDPYDSDNIVFVKDFNGDGKDDVLQVRHNWSGGVASSSTYNIYQSNGDGTFQHQNMLGVLGGFAPAYEFADFNGDGIIDIFQRGPNQGSSKISLVRKNQDRLMLKSVLDGLGRRLSVEYKSLPKAGSQYISGSGSVFPLMDYNGTFFAATRTTFSYTGLPTTTIDFHYTGAIIHRQGKGFMGFRKFKQTNITTGEWVELEFEIMPNFYHPMLKGSMSGIGGQQTETETYSNVISNLGNKRYFPFVQGVVSQDLIKNITVNTDFEFDNFGNLTRQFTNFGNQATEEIIHTYVAAGAWCLSRIQSSTITKRRISPSNSQTKAFNYSYNSNGLLIGESGNGLNKTYVYDSHGNMTSVSLTGVGVTGTRTTSYQYDSKGRVTRITNPGDFVTNYTRLAYTGWIQKEEFPNGSFVTYLYDGFGRFTSKTSTTGVPTTIYHAWANGEHGALTKITTTTAGLPPTIIWYDAYEREIRRQEPGFSASMITLNSYNTKGQLESVTNPDNSTIEYTYDNLGRLSSEAYLGLNKTYSYQGTTVTINSPRDHSITIYDALGNILESTVNGQKVTYTYNALSQPVTIRPQWGAPVTMQYDTYGFQSKVIDPAAGTIEYTYNALGELLSQKNNRNQTSTISYDNFGRVIARSWPGYSTTFEYHTSGGGKGLLKRATLGNVSEEYFYDSYGRMNKVQLEGASIGALSFQYSYNNLGAITSITYPNGFVINRTYNQNGYLRDIKTSTGTIIWRLETVNSAGQITKSFINNSMYHHRTYDSYGFPASIRTDHNLSTIQHFTYEFDNKGNLTRRTDERRNLAEEFTYDNLHRLNIITQPGNITLQHQYEVNGNVSQKTNVGNYEYNLSPNIYAVTGLSGPYANPAPPSQNIIYTPFERPEVITNGAWKGEFVYGPDHQRRLMELYENNVLRETRLYFGLYEEKQFPNGNVYRYCYVDSPEGPIALYRSLNQGLATKFNILTDHLGSITALVNTSGTIVESYSYDAWGRRRDPSDYSLDVDGSQLITQRGFTFHEHLCKLDLINMNSRVYDPVLGRFLSPDPYVQAPNFAQNYNRYSYALNNPLIYTDPDGELFWIPFVVAGIYLGGSIANKGELNPRHWNWKSSNTYLGMVIGGAVGYVGYAAGAQLLAGQMTVKSGVSLLGTGGFYIGFEAFGGSGPSFTWTSNMGETGRVPLSNMKDGNIRNVNNPNPVQVWASVQNSIDYHRPRTSFEVGWPRPLWSQNPRTGLITWYNYANSTLLSLSSLNKVREVLENEYLRQANFNRSLSGNYSQPIKSTLHNIHRVGRFYSTLNVVSSVGQFAVSDKTYGDYGRLAIGLSSAGLTYFPEPITSGIGITIGIVDGFGGFKAFYNYLDYLYYLNK